MDTPARIESKLPDVGVSIFAVMTRLAGEHGAINLSQGFPDFACDPELVEAVHRHMQAGDNQYAPMPGVLALREALAAKIRRLYGAEYDPVTEVTVTSGATEALFDIISAFVRPGDEVVLFEPCYDAYVPVVRLNGGTPRFVTLRAPDYRIDWDQVRRLLSPRTRLLIVNSPHNPTGAILHADDLRALASALDGTGVIVLSDEVYEHIVFDGARHESLARHPALRERTCVVSSFGKTYHTTGWKVGLHRRAAGPDGRGPAGAPVRDVRHEHPGPACVRGVHQAARALRRPRRVLPGEARPVPRAARGLALHAGLPAAARTSRSSTTRRSAGKATRRSRCGC